MHADRPRLIHFDRKSDASGSLTYAEAENEIPFAIRRAFWLYDLQPVHSRGGHAYLRQEQVIVAVAGSFQLKLVHTSGTETITLDRADRGIYLPPPVWREIHEPRAGSVALVFSSRAFDPDDYIRDLGRITGAP